MSGPRPLETTAKPLLQAATAAGLGPEESYLEDMQDDPTRSGLLGEVGSFQRRDGYGRWNTVKVSNGAIGSTAIQTYGPRGGLHESVGFHSVHELTALIALLVQARAKQIELGRQLAAERGEAFDEGEELAAEALELVDGPKSAVEDLLGSALAADVHST